MMTSIIQDFFHCKQTFFEKHFAEFHHPYKEEIKKLICISEYATRQMEVLKKMLLYEGEFNESMDLQRFLDQIKQVSQSLPTPEFMKEIRLFRHRQLLRLALREIANLSTTEETMREWSYCADALILHTLEFCHQQLSKQFGIPNLEGENSSKLFVLAMGKLGGCELNFSSDVDLIFLFTGEGDTRGPEIISLSQYYTKVVQLFVKLFNSITPDGLVFRVDLRLRPNGESGPIALPVSAIETYYQQQGRDWERYAMVKARVIGEKPTWFERIIKPFVYRKYVDFSVIESLRTMKNMIEREIEFNPMLNDIKRGRGGIREIEFIIQCFQLVRGGRLPSLQKTNAIEALRVLDENHLITHSRVLKEAYLFLRKLENALQIHSDQQTHTIPNDPLTRYQIAFAMGFDNENLLLKKLTQYRRIISLAFQAVLAKPDTYQNEKKLFNNQLLGLWQGHIEPSMSVNVLRSIGFENAEHAYQMLYSFRNSHRCRRLSQAARARLDDYIVLLLAKLTENNSQALLLPMMRLLENIVGRSAYLALLTERPAALNEVLELFTKSPYLSALLCDHPFLLEVLIDIEIIYGYNVNGRILKQQLYSQLQYCQDNEQRAEVLRQFKLKNWFLTARAELVGTIDSQKAARILTEVALIIVEQVCESALNQLAIKNPLVALLKNKFAIIAYGKLGSGELNYDSDVDLVFIHTGTGEEETLMTRLVQKIIYMLTLRTQSGILFRVDTRLRPSGAAGLLVSHKDAFSLYQKTQAWTWEHQALLKARLIVGDPIFRRFFTNLKKSIFLMKRDSAFLASEIQGMRLKIVKYIEGFHDVGLIVKNQKGGLTDLEFFVHFLILSHPNTNMTSITNTKKQLQKLLELNYLHIGDYNVLVKAYHDYHHFLHNLILRESIELEGLAIIAKKIAKMIEKCLCNFSSSD